MLASCVCTYGASLLQIKQLCLCFRQNTKKISTPQLKKYHFLFIYSSMIQKSATLSQRSSSRKTNQIVAFLRCFTSSLKAFKKWSPN